MASSLLWRGATIAYGLFTLSVFTVIATLDGSVFSRPTQKEKKQIAAAQDKYWSLGSQPFGLKHKFFTLRSGHKLHYVERMGASQKANLVVFIHGFPDSWVLWKSFLTSRSLSQHATLVAVDLPGYGGSDDLPDSGAETILESMTEFILGMRERYITTEEPRKVLIVGHDWGAIITVRLAAEAPVLADRFIIASAVLPSLAVANTRDRFASAKQMLRTYFHSPTSIRLLWKACATISPVLSQFSKSGYIFTFNLPAPLSNAFGRLGNAWFLRTIHRVARRENKFLVDIPAAEAMAASIGPSASECHPSTAPATSSEEPLSYPESVARRIPTGGWSNKLRLYRQGLFLSPWTKSLETVFALSTLEQEEQRQHSPHSRHRPSTAGLFESGPPGALLSQATIIYGMKDPAFESRLGLEGMSDYLVRGSQAVLIEKGGHWLPMEKEGSQVLEEVITWSIEGEKGSLRTWLAETCERFGKRIRIAVDN